MLSPVTEKYVILIGMFVATLFFSMIPFKLIQLTHNSSKWKKIVSFSSCFSGGVFIGACILDLFPDVHEAMNHVLDEIEEKYHTKIDYPVAGFVICCGFFLVLIIEQIILECKESWQKPLTVTVSETTPLIHNNDEAHNNHQIRSGSGYGSVEDAINDDHEHNTPLIHNNDDAHNTHQIRTGSRYGSAEDGIDSIPSISAVDNNDEHNHLGDVFQHSTMRSLLLCIALSFHSIFEGLAIGLQKDIGELISLFLAVIAHKAVMAFSLGLTLAQARLNWKQYMTAILIFTVASPLGMGIGIALSDMEQTLAGDIANSILQGIAGGTFLYITFFEVLPHELNQKDHRMLKLMFVLIGFACICGLLFITH